MAYDPELACRIKILMSGLPSLEEKKMFGGVGFLLRGNLACGVNKNDMIVRVDPLRPSELLTRPYTRPFDITGKPTKGWLIVEAGGLKTEVQLVEWVKESVDFALALPPKEK